MELEKVNFKIMKKYKAEYKTAKHEPIVCEFEAKDFKHAQEVVQKITLFDSAAWWITEVKKHKL